MRCQFTYSPGQDTYNKSCEVQFNSTGVLTLKSMVVNFNRLEILPGSPHQLRVRYTGSLIANGNGNVGFPVTYEVKNLKDAIFEDFYEFKLVPSVASNPLLSFIR